MALAIRAGKQAGICDRYRAMSHGHVVGVEQGGGRRPQKVPDDEYLGLVDGRLPHRNCPPQIPSPLHSTYLADRSGLALVLPNPTRLPPPSGSYMMAPSIIPEAQAQEKIETLVNACRKFPTTCNCGRYGFKFALCPHTRFQVANKCGLTCSGKTGLPIFCMKKAPTITLPDHVLPRKCKDCWKEGEKGRLSIYCLPSTT